LSIKKPEKTFFASLYTRDTNTFNPIEKSQAMHQKNALEMNDW